jgi:DNA invertase Pin-like site-specific DNA recombinase
VNRGDADVINVPAVARPARSGRRREQSAIADEIVAASYSRYSSDLQDESSISQQQRRCREAASKNAHIMQAECEFFDEAVSGTKVNRDGLNAMLAAARAGQFQVLYLDCLSRLARECVISLPMLKELVYVHHVRVISVSDGVDSSSGNWELLAMFRSYMHQEYLKTLREAVLRGQVDAVLNDFSVGDWCFGYGSEAIPGSEAGRRGRNAKPRMRYIINEAHADWVRRIFSWFVDERRSINWIAKKLTELGAPKDHRSRTPGWHPAYVRRVLRNRKYIGRGVD